MSGAVVMHCAALVSVDAFLILSTRPLHEVNAVIMERSCTHSRTYNIPSPADTTKAKSDDGIVYIV